MLSSNKDSTKEKDIVTVYRNRKKKCSLTFPWMIISMISSAMRCSKMKVTVLRQQKHRILLPVGQNCKLRYPVTYEYVKGILIQYKPWSKENPLTNLLKIKSLTIRTFKRMMDKKQFPSCIRNQYILSIKYSQQAELEFLDKHLIQQPYELSNMDDDKREACIARQNVSHFSDGKHHNKVIDDMPVDIGTHFDWSKSLFKEKRDVSIDGTSWVDAIREQHANAVKDQAKAIDNLVIST